MWIRYGIGVLHQSLFDDITVVTSDFPKHVRELPTPTIKTIHDESDLPISYKAFINRTTETFGGEINMIFPYEVNNKTTKVLGVLASYAAGTVGWPKVKRLMLPIQIRLENERVLFISREIKDTIVSSYFQFTKRTFNDDGKPYYSGSIEDFVYDERFGVKKIIAFWNNWHERESNVKSFMRVTYEELHKDPVGMLTKMCEFVDLDVGEENVKAVVNATSFENMKKAEREGRQRWQGTSKDYKHEEEGVIRERVSHERASHIDPNDNDCFKVRKGKVGGYVDYLNDKEIDYIDNLVKDVGCPYAGTPYNTNWKVDILK
jgi:hypothetical protein